MSQESGPGSGEDVVEEVEVVDDDAVEAVGVDGSSVIVVVGFVVVVVDAVEVAVVVVLVDVAVVVVVVEVVDTPQENSSGF